MSLHIVPARPLTARLLTGTVCSALAFAGLAVVTQAPAEAAPLNSCVKKDNGDPVLDSLTLSPLAVDVTTGMKTVNVSAAIHDTGGPGSASGIANANVTLTGPGGSKSVYANLTKSGGSYVGTLKFPQWTTNGVWNVQYVNVTDKVSNYRAYLNNQLPAGSDTSVVVTSVADTTPPTLTSVSISPATVDTRRKAKKVTVTATATDAEAGVNRIIVGANRGADHFSSATLKKVSGNTFRGKLPINTWVGSGQWKLNVVAAVDNVENRHDYTYADLGTAGFDRSFNVKSKSDTAKPTLVSYKRLDQKVDVRRHGDTVSFVVKASDARSGVGYVSVAMNSSDTLFSTSANLKLTKGTAKNGTWTGKAKLTPCTATKDVWPIGVYVDDNAGNTTFKKKKGIVVRAKDHVPPRAFPISGNKPVAGPITVKFADDVNGIDASSFQVQPPIVNVALPGTLACRAKGGGNTNCLTGKVRTVSYTPDVPLASGSDYYVILNPEHVLKLTDLAGNPFKRFYLYFHTQ